MLKLYHFKYCKVKGKVVPVLNELISTPSRRTREWMYFLDLDTSCRCGQLHVLASLPPVSIG
jgi:hypothetical protein